jgi:CCR4-NOT transcriptional regulation complex NOT5 subunit
MVKGKTKQRPSLRISSGSSRKVSKPKVSLNRRRRPRLVPNVESIDPDSEEASAPQANQVQAGGAEESDSSSSSDTTLSSSRRVAQARTTSLSGPQSSVTAPVVSSTLSSTITKSSNSDDIWFFIMHSLLGKRTFNR